VVKPGKISGVILILLAGILFFPACANDKSSVKPADTQSPTTYKSATPTTSQSVIKTPVVSTTTTRPAEATAEEIALNAVTAIQGTKYFKYDMEFSMSLTMPFEGTIKTMTMKETATSSVDLQGKKMASVMDMTLAMPGEDSKEMAGEIYLVDGWMYMKAAVSGTGDQWTKMKLTDELWAAQSQFTNMADFLKTPTNLEITGSENIGGVDCYVVNVVPGANALMSWTTGQMQSMQGQSSLQGMNLSEILKGFLVKEWIAKDSFSIVRQQIDLSLDMASVMPTSPTNSASQMSMEMSALLNYRDYGEPVDIQLPAEALTASEVVVSE
jgi:hypothetical protein